MLGASSVLTGDALQQTSDDKSDGDVQGSENDGCGLEFLVGTFC